MLSKKGICPHCGQELDKDGKGNPVDHKTVDRVVRKAAGLFKGVRPGGKVAVCVEELNAHATKTATMTLEEHAAALALANAPKPQTGTSSVEMAQKFAEGSRQDWDRQKKHNAVLARRDAEKAAHRAAEAEGDAGKAH